MRRRVALACAVTAVVSCLTTSPLHSAVLSDWINQRADYWGIAYNVPPDMIRGVIVCESGGQDVTNASGHVGILQFSPVTYESMRAQENADPYLAPNLPYYDPEPRSLWTDATDQEDAEIHLFAWAVAHGMGTYDNWECLNATWVSE